MQMKRNFRSPKTVNIQYEKVLTLQKTFINLQISYTNVKNTQPKDKSQLSKNYYSHAPRDQKLRI